MNRIIVAAGVVCLHALCCSTAWAQPKLPHSPSDREITMLPAECKVLLKGSTAEKSVFYQQFPGLVGPNHYCWGLNFMNRARFETNKTEKRFNLQSAIGEFNYVLKHSAENARGLQQIKEYKEEADRLLKAL